MTLSARVHAVGAAVWRWAFVLWVCRVPVAGALAGGVLLIFTAQARDLFADLGLGLWQWMALIILIFVWAWIVHAVARRALQYDDWIPETHTPEGLTPQRREELRELFYRPALVVPRLFGTAIFAFVLLSMWRTTHNLVEAQNGLPEAAEAVRRVYWLMAATVVAGAVYIYLIWKRRTFGDWLSRKGLRRGASAPPLLSEQLPFLTAIGRPRQFLADVLTSGLDMALTLARVAIVAALLLTIVNPHLVATWVPRLYFVPLLLGGAILLLGEVAALSFRWRTPLLLVVVGVSIGCVFLTWHFHDVRWVAKAERQDAGTRQISMDTAVARWMAANGCTPAGPEACPRPILIAGAGGASRAAFLTATVVGALMDLKADSPYGSGRNRIFALSTVSGSSLGAVVMRAAMLDAFARSPDKANVPPCTQAGTGSWFGQPLVSDGPDAKFDPKRSWRDCFQLILAGDFLSPAFVGLAYRDNFPLPDPRNWHPLWADRAALLEQGFERRYHRMTSTDQASTTCPDGPGQDSTGQDSKGQDSKGGLCRLFGYHVDMSAAKTWLPLLLINGTSVRTGRRIVASDLKVSETVPLAYDLNEIARGQNSSDEPRDIRLSTAATMSARFPVISPQGVFRDQAGNITDSVVDGGYFENDGLATAADVVLQLKEYKLDPVVIRIVNEPVAPKIFALGQGRPPLPDREARTPFDDALSIVNALTATRSGHEDGHEAYLRSVLNDRGQRLFEINVYELNPTAMRRDGSAGTDHRDSPFCRRPVTSQASMENVSMSWWVSQPVQAYLDAQLCVRENWDALECELKAGRLQGGECGSKVSATSERGITKAD